MRPLIICCVWLFAANIAFCGSLDSLLTAHYPFCGNANDLSGNNNHGVVNGATLTSDRFGNANSAYSFDGVDDEIRIKNPFNQYDVLNKSLSYSVWIKSNSSKFASVIISHLNTCINADYFALVLYNANLWAGIELNTFMWTSSRIGTSRIGIADNNWHHIVVNFDKDKDTLSLFVDGQLKSIKKITYNSQFVKSTDLVIGGQNTDGCPDDHSYLGIIDDVRIYSRVISLQEISNLYLEKDLTQNSVSILGPRSDTICEGSTIRLRANTLYDTDIYWSNGQCGDTLNIESSGKYIASTYTSCKLVKDSVYIFVDSTDNITLEITGKDSLCPGELTTILALGANNGKGIWLPNTNSPLLTVDKPGTYVFKCESSFCPGFIDSVYIFKKAPPQITLTPRGQQIICPNTSLQVSVASNMYFSWEDNNSTSTNRTLESENTYIVSASNSCGESRDSIELIFSLIDAQFDVLNQYPLIYEALQLVNQSTSDYPITSWTWTTNEGDSYDGEKPSIFFNNKGLKELTLAITDSFGCSDVYKIQLEAFGANMYLHPINAFSPNGDGINDSLYFISEGVISLQTQVYTRWGEKIYESNSKNDRWDGKYLSKTIQPGSYLLIQQIRWRNGTIDYRNYIITVF